MRIAFIVPPDPGSPTGNRNTTSRWAGVLRGLGHDVEVATEWCGEGFDLLLALHAYKTRRAVLAFRRARPAAPIVVGLSGTDIYNRASVTGALGPVLRAADALVMLQPLALSRVPADVREKAVTIYQSVAPMKRRPPRTRTVDICLLANLRRVKDPLRPAMAARRLPEASRIRIVHAGAALGEKFRLAAEAEMTRNRRYSWRGSLTPTRARDLLLRSAALVIPSRSEGGANVVGEAAVAGIPILASRMDGNVGLLGADYAGYFEVGDTAGLRALMIRFETEPRLVRRLTAQVRARRPLFAPAKERKSWATLMKRVREGDRLSREAESADTLP